MEKSVLIIDDDPLIVELMINVLKKNGYRVCHALTGIAGIQMFEASRVDVVVLDYSLPDMCGEDVYRRLKSIAPGVIIVFITGFPNVNTAVGLMKAGAYDYICKPFRLDDILKVIDIATMNQRARWSDTKDDHELDLSEWSPGEYCAGTSISMHSVDRQISTLQQYPRATVLISGPTGSGKSAVARKIHQVTRGESAPFVEIDCLTIPHGLCESELFGHEKGAFTGAHNPKPGLFEIAEDGTAFLDEIGDLELSLQAKLLRVLEERWFRRVGGQTMISMTARVIAATHHNLSDLVAQKRFRQDLYYRLNVFEINIPALKDHRSDIRMLATRFLKYYVREYRKPVQGFSPETMAFLENYSFPGNVRELRNVVERAVVSAKTRLIEIEDIMLPSLSGTSQAPITTPVLPPIQGSVEVLMKEPSAARMNLVELEKEKVTEALHSAGGNKSKAAKLVGLSRTAFYRRLRKHNLEASGTLDSEEKIKNTP